MLMSLLYLFYPTTLSSLSNPSHLSLRPPAPVLSSRRMPSLPPPCCGVSISEAATLSSLSHPLKPFPSVTASLSSRRCHQRLPLPPPRCGVSISEAATSAICGPPSPTVTIFLSAAHRLQHLRRYKGNMDGDIDHYVVLGLSSGEEGSKLSEKEITKAYRLKAFELHPDKRPDDPDALVNFQKLQTSYQILKDEKARKLFDDLLRVKLQKLQRQSQQDSKRRRMMSDLEERERTAFYQDSTTQAKSEEEIIARKLKEEINRIRMMYSNKMTSTAAEASPSKKESVGGGKGNVGGGLSDSDKEKMLKVSWEKVGIDYNAERLRKLFESFGEVKDVVIRSSKKKGSALIVMATKEAAVSATGTVCGDLSNPLLVVPLQPSVTTAFLTDHEPVKTNVSQLNENLVGTRYQAFEVSVLQKLQKAAKRQK